MKTLLVLAALFSTVGAFGFDPPRESLNQNGTRRCPKSIYDTCSLTFELLTTDTFDLIYLEHPDNASINTATTFNSVTGEITGDGTPGNPYWVNITVDCSTMTQTLLDPAVAPIKITDPDVIEVNFIVKTVYQAPFFETAFVPLDVRYPLRCNFSEPPTGTAVTPGATLVFGSNTEQSVLVGESSTIVMIRPTLSPTAPSSVAGFGEDIFFRLDVDPLSANVAGYLFNCDMCSTDDCASPRRFIDDNGCSLNEAFFPRFTLVGNEVRTAVFEAFLFGGTPVFYIQCEVGYSESLTDPKVVDFCTFNGGTGRKKRQASERTERIESRFRITFGTPDGDVTVDVDDNTSNTERNVKTIDASQANIGLLAAVITLAGVLLVGLIVAVVVFIHLAKRSMKPEGKA